ncbi:aminotransferase [Xylariaceae sp. FL0804]|nr:aminotransferase [Xylariaceae sp. FL0804]
MADFRIFTSIRYDPILLEGREGNSSTTAGRLPTNSPFYMLDFHRDRMLRAAEHWHWGAAAETLAGDEGLERLRSMLVGATRPAGSIPHRVKVLLAPDGSLDSEMQPTPPRPLSKLLPYRLPEPSSEEGPHAEADRVPLGEVEFEVFLDKESTVRSAFTHHKTTHRPMYEEARRRAGLSPAEAKEVLLFSKTDGSVMEGSISTPYFWRDGRWVTPPVSAEFSETQGSGGNDGTTRRWALERNLATEQVVPADSLFDGEECWISTGVRGFVHGQVRLR